MAHQCEYCGRSFDSEQGLSIHQGKIHTDELPHHDEDLLRELYLEKRLSSTEIAERLGISKTAIKGALQRFDIPRRSRAEAKRLQMNKRPAHFRTAPSRHYEVWVHSTGDTQHTVSVHRLLAVAEYGFDAVCGKVVHHINGIKWDNRPSNIALMDDSEHKSLHASGEAFNGGECA